MKLSSVRFLAAVAFVSPACSLVTVPVKVAGGIVETTVKTTGDVVTAPFNAIGGSNRDNKSHNQPQKSSDSPSIEATKSKE